MQLSDTTPGVVLASGGPRLSFLTPEERLLKSVRYFGKHFTFVVDGSEQPVPSSSQIFRNNEFFSVKKKKATINILIVIHIKTRRILYLSESVPGSVNDNVLTRKTQKEWLDKLSPLEHGLGNEGFNGMINLRIETNGVNESTNNKMKKYRIRVENVIETCKNFGMLSRRSKFQSRVNTRIQKGSNWNENNSVGGERNSWDMFQFEWHQLLFCMKGTWLPQQQWMPEHFHQGQCKQNLLDHNRTESEECFDKNGKIWVFLGFFGFFGSDSLFSPPTELFSFQLLPFCILVFTLDWNFDLLLT